MGKKYISPVIALSLSLILSIGVQHSWASSTTMEGSSVTLSGSNYVYTGSATAGNNRLLAYSAATKLGEFYFDLNELSSNQSKLPSIGVLKISPTQNKKESPILSWSVIAN